MFIRYKASQWLLLPYLLELLSGYQPARHLQSSSCLFSKPAATSYFASCAFYPAVRSVWNSLEPNLQSATLLSHSPPSNPASVTPAVHSTVHCQAAPPIRTRHWTLYKLYCILLLCPTQRVDVEITSLYYCCALVQRICWIRRATLHQVPVMMSANIAMAADHAGK